MTIRTPGSHLDAALAAGRFDDGVRTEVTEPVPTRQAIGARPEPVAAASDPIAGVARRAGRGFIASYGDGRTCATAGCATWLSQYNGGDRCGLHDQRHPGPPGTH